MHSTRLAALHSLLRCSYHSRCPISGCNLAALVSRLPAARQVVAGCRVHRSYQSCVDAMLRVGVECVCADSGLLISTVVPRCLLPGPLLSSSSESILCPFCVPCSRRVIR